jgi:hypothetical protein
VTRGVVVGHGRFLEHGQERRIHHARPAVADDAMTGGRPLREAPPSARRAESWSWVSGEAKSVLCGGKTWAQRSYLVRKSSRAPRPGRVTRRRPTYPVLLRLVLRLEVKAGAGIQCAALLAALSLALCWVRVSASFGSPTELANTGMEGAARVEC